MAAGAGTAAGADTELRRILAALPRPPTEVAAAILDELADADSPRGLVAAARLPRGGVETLPAAAGGAEGIVVWVEGLQDPGNLGALARSAEAAGASALALAPGTVHPNHPRALRASAGSLLRLPVAVGVTIDELDEHLGGGKAAGPGSRAAGPFWLALATRGGEDLWQVPLVRPLVLALGAEGPGLSAAAATRADVLVTIPLGGAVESLNATVAASLVLFEIRRRLRISTQRAAPSSKHGPGPASQRPSSG